MKRAIIFGVVVAVPFWACAKSPPKGSGSTGGAGGTTSAGGTASGGNTPNTGGTASTGGVCSVTIPSEAGASCDIETPIDAGAPLDAGSASDLTKMGPYAVGHVNYTLADTSVYGRPVIVSVFYPVDADTITAAATPAQYPLDPWSSDIPVSTSTDWETLGYDPAYEQPAPSASGPFPLVMVSPGYADDNWEYLYIGTRLASHGYVVAAIDHQNEGQFSWSPPANSGVVAMFNRTRDVSFAITELLSKSDAAGELLHGIIDSSKIAMSGHSLGGYAAYALAGGDDKVCDALWVLGGDSTPQYTCVASPPDPRIRAIVSLDGASNYMRYGELARIAVPSLIMGESFDQLVAYALVPSDWHARSHAAIHRSDSHRIDIAGSNHWSFSAFCDGFKVMSRLGMDADTAVPGISPGTLLCAAQGSFDPANNPGIRQTVTTYMLAFLNTYLGREDDAWMLTSSYATQYQPRVLFFGSEACTQCQPGPDEYAYRPHPCQCSVAPRDPVSEFPIPGFQIQDHGYVVAGTWAGYASPVAVTSSALGAVTTTITPADYSGVVSGAPELCAQGSIGVSSDDGGSALIEVNLNQAQSAQDGGISPLQTVAIGGSGITVQYRNPGNSAIRLRIQTPTGGTDPTGRWCTTLSIWSGMLTVPWTNFWGGVADATKDCTNLGGIHPPPGTEISTVSLYAPAGGSAALPYQFCLQGLAQAP
jgi:predicted dienelactone hydrolase